MFTIEDYINSLKNDKATLVDNLETKGITNISDDNTFTELVPKVLDIESVNNQNKQITITSNGTTNVVPDTGYTGLGNVEITTNVETDLSEYFNNSLNTYGSNYNPAWTYMVKKLPSFVPTNTNASYLFTRFGGTELPNFDSSNITTMDNMCASCSYLVTIPVWNTSSVTSFYNTFTGCNALSDTSLDNILQMCINATSYTGTKTLLYIGVNKNYYPASKIEALSHYQDFINAGWTLGY